MKKEFTGPWSHKGGETLLYKISELDVETQYVSMSRIDAVWKQQGDVLPYVGKVEYRVLSCAVSILETYVIY